MKRILILANSASGLYDFRNELLLRLLKEGYEVHISLPDEDKVPELVTEGCKVYHTPLDRRGMNPVRDMKLMRAYDRLLAQIKPDVVLYEEGLDSRTLQKSIEYISNADILIIGGTSLAVYPAAGLIDYYRGNKLVLINKSATDRKSVV